MSTRFHDHRPERRRFLAGAASLAAYAALPMTALCAVAGVSTTKPRAWLGWFDEQLGQWLPAAYAAGREVTPEQQLTLAIRGPWTAAGNLVLGVVYHSLPSQPFLLPMSASGGIVLHAQASALAGIQLWRQGESPEHGSLCALNCGRTPLLQPGRYALLIDDTGVLRSPDWSAVAAGGAEPLLYQGQPAPNAVLSVRIAPLSPQTELG